MLLQKSGTALSHSVEPFILSLSVLWERLCLRLLRNFRITAYGKLHMCFSSGYLLLIHALSDCKYTKNHQNNYCNIMEDAVIKWTAICIILGLAQCILMSVDSYSKIILVIFTSFSPSARGTINLPGVPLHIPELWSCGRKRITLHLFFDNSFFLKSQQMSL